MKSTQTSNRRVAVVDMTASPYCTLRPVPVSAVRLTDDFWAPRITTNREATIPSQLKHCEETGRIDNFRRASGKITGEFVGIYFNDSDVYKWMEAASWSLAAHPDARLEADLDAVIAEVASAQEADGYLDTYFTGDRIRLRFANLKDMHEIYCAGHLFQAAVAHFRATGKRTLLDVALRLADHLYDRFGPDGKPGACGHEEAEMGLVELYRVTGDRRYLDLAKRMIDVRGAKPPVLGGSPYHQDHQPFKDQDEMIGHAVRHLYLCCGAADVVAETGDTELLQALDRLWQNFTRKKMYVTGGAGSRWEGEAFGADYELPNTRAYTETCAAIGSVMWNWRMLHLTGLAQYADLIELTLYNAILPGISLDGKSYFYQNPLADRGKHRREPWFGCACCPPNVARLLASLPGYFYSTGDDGIAVHLYAKSTAQIEINPGASVTIRQETDYPWSGDVALHLDSVPDREFTLYLRVPFWVDDELVTLSVNGEDQTEALTGEPGMYRAIRRQWVAGDTVELSLPMPVELVESHPYVLNNRGRVALQRGPLVYCFEQADNPEFDPWDLAIGSGTQFKSEGIEIDGQSVIAINVDGLTRTDVDPQDTLYSSYSGEWDEDFKPVSARAIPYYAWANREAGPMVVWVPVRPQE